MEATYDPVLDNDSPENKGKYWDVAFGLQAVDGLKPSAYVRGAGGSIQRLAGAVMGHKGGLLGCVWMVYNCGIHEDVFGLCRFGEAFCGG